MNEPDKTCEPRPRLTGHVVVVLMAIAGALILASAAQAYSDQDADIRLAALDRRQAEGRKIELAFQRSASPAKAGEPLQRGRASKGAVPGGGALMEESRERSGRATTAGQRAQ